LALLRISLEEIFQKAKIIGGSPFPKCENISLIIGITMSLTNIAGGDFSEGEGDKHTFKLMLTHTHTHTNAYT